METLFIIWLLCAITTAVIASSKGRSGFGWFIIGFLGGFFGLIAVCAMPRLEAQASEPRVTTDRPGRKWYENK